MLCIGAMETTTAVKEECPEDMSDSDAMKHVTLTPEPKSQTEKTAVIPEVTLAGLSTDGIIITSQDATVQLNRVTVTVEGADDVEPVEAEVTKSPTPSSPGAEDVLKVEKQPGEEPSTFVFELVDDIGTSQTGLSLRLLFTGQDEDTPFTVIITLEGCFKSGGTLLGIDWTYSLP